jgi:transposase
MYAKVGRPSIPPEQLLKAGVLMALYSIRSERQFCERLQYDLLFKWFLGLNVQDPAFDATTFSKNRERLMDNLVSKLFFQAVLEEARQRHLLSNQHFTVDGTLLESWASLKSLERKPNLGGKHKSKRRRGGGPKGREAAIGTPKSIGVGRSGRMRRTNPRPIPKPGWLGKERSRPSSATRAMC